MTGGRYDPIGMDVVAEAARLRAAAAAKPLRLPINRRIDESHHAVTADGLGVWFTVQMSPNRRITEAVFERNDRRPSDEECQTWLMELVPDQAMSEAPGLPDAQVRRFGLFEMNPPRMTQEG